ncbi:trehalose-phosphatase [Pseudoclavibacter sp. CFCC 11306]|uniref:trehalose-phosphatase n=1 Tax=Pseudoclavibacter sp. CFCC 11306 TaxID=1564493 RepID=UPI00130198DB|nr:trehalose-phosphatase [Pseudoclavibacter sp. CFCC 11306]KAB1657012.1 trehalose-phosphatase [Pseudoclavibacter sp. CFCC 11306]
MTPELDAALQRITETERLLIALDFDGTVAPFTDNPADSRSLADSHLAVIQLWQLPRTDVAYVSGRALESLRAVSDAPPGMLLVGSHGAQIQLDSGVPDPSPLSTGTIRDVSRLSSTLEDLVTGVHGAWVEHKPVGAVLHTRSVGRAEAERLQRLARERVAAELPVARVLTGHDVLEFSLRETNKGDAIEQLRTHTGATVVFYAGDDRTDEDVFRVLHDGDVGVHVGEGRTAAEFTVAGPRALAGVLLTMASRRRRYLALAR